MKHEIKDFEGWFMLRLTLENGDEYQIRAEKGKEGIEVQTIDGSMKILPSVSNVIRVQTNH